MSGAPPEYIDFGAYTRDVPQNIPRAVQHATTKFLKNREARVAELPQWEELRQAASDIKLHTLNHLDVYLERLEQKVTAAGGHVHWAEDAAQARNIVLDIAQKHGVSTVVKAKSMATEEIGLNHALEQAGIQPFESDLGEFIIQLAGTGPSHIIIPAVHLKKEEIAELFKKKLGVDAPADAEELTLIAHRALREKFLSAEMGISGGNFLVAETGTLVVVTNEGNGRMSTTVPDVHVAVVGIDKVVPDWETLAVLLKLLARSATGQKLSTYTSFITGPGRADGEGGPKELHLVLLDNGRSRILGDPVGRETLKCIRCGSCLNACPVYKHVGGYAYGWFISGPIGAIFTPQILGTQAARELPFASTLCGACVDACPVKVPITKLLLHLRRRVAEGDRYAEPSAPVLSRVGARLGSWSLSTGMFYRLGATLARWLQTGRVRDGWIDTLPAPLDRWTQVRPMRALGESFRAWWAKRDREGT